MPRRTNHLILTVGFLAVALLCHSLSADSAVNLQQQTHRLHLWMGMTPQAQAWRNYLKMPLLESQLVLGNSADINHLKTVAKQFNSGAPGLDHPIFAAVAKALNLHISNLEKIQGLELSTAFANAKFRTIDENVVGPIRQHALNELGLMARYYRATMTAEQADAALKALGAENLQQLIATKFDKLAQRELVAYFRRVSTAVRKFRGTGSVGRNDAYFPPASEAVERYRLIVQAFGRSSRLKTNFSKDLESLKSNVEKLPKDRTLAMVVGQQLRAFEGAGQIPELITLVKSKFGQPNAYVAVSEELANQFASLPVNQSQMVSETILGRLIKGVATTYGNVTVDFVDHPTQAHVSLRLRGMIDTDSYTREGPITAFSKSNAEVEARRSVLADLGGIQVFDSYVAASLNSRFCGTDCIRLVDRIAERQFLKDKDAFEKVGAYKSEERLKREFDKQTDDVLRDAQPQLAKARQKFAKRLADEQSKIQQDLMDAKLQSHAGRYRLLEPRFHVRTTNTHLQVVAFAADHDQLTAFSKPPAVKSKAAITLQLHESFFSNVASYVFKGDTYQSVEIPQLVKTLAPNADPVELNEKDRFSITFDQSRPIQFRYNEGKFEIVVAASRFINNGQRYNTPILIVQKFNIERTSNRVSFIGDGLPSVKFREPGRKDAAETGFRRLLETRIHEAIEKSGQETPQIDLPPNLIPSELVAKMKDPSLVNGLQLAEFDVSEGWWTLGYNIDQATIERLKAQQRQRQQSGNKSGIPFEINPRFDDITGKRYQLNDNGQSVVPTRSTTMPARNTSARQPGITINDHGVFQSVPRNIQSPTRQRNR